MPATSDPESLFTERHTSYARFIRLVRYSYGIQAFFMQSALLRSGLRVLDAGCGTGRRHAGAARCARAAAIDARDFPRL